MLLLYKIKIVSHDNIQDNYIPYRIFNIQTQIYTQTSAWIRFPTIRRCAPYKSVYYYKLLLNMLTSRNPSYKYMAEFLNGKKFQMGSPI